MKAWIDFFGFHIWRTVSNLGKAFTELANPDVSVTRYHVFWVILMLLGLLIFIMCIGLESTYAY